jgi:molecular chaperone IbpA
MNSSSDFSRYRPSTVGFERLFDHLENARSQTSDEYPPFDVEQLSADSFLITLAVPGFKPDEIEIVEHQSQLTVSGKREEGNQGDRRYLHRGIAVPPFERSFELADYVHVIEAATDNGLLRISLKREIPEAMKPHRIPVGGADESSVGAPKGS